MAEFEDQFTDTQLAEQERAAEALGQETATEGREDPSPAHDPQDGPESRETGAEGQDDGPETFPAAVVKELREENAKLRHRSKRSDDLRKQLVHAMADRTGKMADPTDLPVSDDLMGDDGMPDAEKIGEAIDALLEKKPHLASTRPRVSDIGQGPRPGTQEVSLADILREGA